jgi:phosphomevalonate kinase
MRTFAPGKLVLTGAYAVLEGAPAIAVAVSRGAYADSSRVASAPTPEVRAALGEASAPHVDASAMFHDARKLGLGASAAIVVATLAALEAGSGSALADFSVRERLFATARDAHARAQVGGSGVDVAASVHGGAIRYVMDAPVQKVALPHGLLVRVFACGVSARTSELRGAIDKLARAEPSVRRPSGRCQRLRCIRRLPPPDGSWPCASRRRGRRGNRPSWIRRARGHGGARASLLLGLRRRGRRCRRLCRAS